MESKEWVSYDIAIKLKEIGFYDNCIYHYKKNDNSHTEIPTFVADEPYGKNHNLVDTRVSAPLKQQVFRFFREKYGYIGYVDKIRESENYYPIVNKVSYKYTRLMWRKTYEEAEELCIKELIILSQIK